VSVVITAFNEERSIGSVVEGFRKELAAKGVPHEIIVVNNNSTDRTSDVALEHEARIVTETKQGYGYACIMGLKHAKGKAVVLTEGDSTFNPRDIWKLLVYLDEEDVDMVLGTRTTLELVDRHAKMNWLLHWGNLTLAKLIQIQFWNKCRLTDVGCTLRAVKRDRLAEIVGDLRVGGSAFSPEMIIWSLKRGLRTVEIPVRYMNRVGDSKITSNYRKTLRVGFEMLKLILSQRFWEDSKIDT
jgi:glycosyltransferase involved in cell wall biosynthesis